MPEQRPTDHYNFAGSADTFSAARIMIVNAARLDWFLIARRALGWDVEARIELADYLEHETSDDALSGIADVLRGVRFRTVRTADKGFPS